LKNFDVKNQIKLSENRSNLQPPSENSKIQLTPIVISTNSYDNFADCRDDKNLQSENLQFENLHFENLQLENLQLENLQLIMVCIWATILERQMQIIDGIQSKASDMKNQFRKKFR